MQTVTTDSSETKMDDSAKYVALETENELLRQKIADLEGSVTKECDELRKELAKQKQVTRESNRRYDELRTSK